MEEVSVGQGDFAVGWSWSRKISERLRLKFEVTALERFSMPKRDDHNFLNFGDQRGAVRAASVRIFFYSPTAQRVGGLKFEVVL